MTYFFMGLMALGVVAVDQLSKCWVANNIASTLCYDPSVCMGHLQSIRDGFGVTERQMAELPNCIDGIDGVFHLSHTHNTGAAFSSLEGMRWLFLVIFLVLTVLIVWEFAKKKMGFTAFERWCIVAVWAGGLGNMIDRMRLSFVVDMIDVDFMNFPVFNVADCFITCGCIALIVHLLFFNKAFWKDKK